MSRWHGGKGSRKRPANVSREQYEANLSLALTKKPIKTGWEQLDDSIDIVRGKITTFFSHAAAGKSVTLFNAAINAANNNLRTVVISGENTEGFLCDRIKTINGFLSPMMTLKHIGTNNVNDIIRFMNTQFSVDVLVLDFADLFVSSEADMEALEQLAIKKNFAIITGGSLPRASDDLSHNKIAELSDNAIIIEDINDADSAGFYVYKTNKEDSKWLRTRFVVDTETFKITEINV